MYRFLKWFSIALLILVIGFVAVLVWAQTESGRKTISATLERAVTASTGLRLDLGHLTGLVPFDFTLERLALSDGEGLWLEMHYLHLRVSIPSLLALSPSFEEISCRNLHVLRIPVTGPDGEKKIEEEAPSFPPDLPAIDLERVVVDSLLLGEEVAGERALFTLEGEYHGIHRDPGTVLALDGKRLDGERLQLEVRAVREEDEEVRRALVRFREEKGGLVARSLGLSVVGSLELEVHAELTGRVWHTAVRTQLGEEVVVDGAFELESVDGFRLSGSGVALIPPIFLPDPLVPFVGRSFGLGLLAHASPSLESFSVDSLFLSGDNWRLHLNGAVNTVDSTVTARCNLSADGSPDLLNVSGLETLGSLDAECDVSGTLGRPDAELSLEVHELGVAGYGIRFGSLKLSSHGFETSRPHSSNVDFTGSVDVRGVSAPPDITLPDSAVSLSFDGQRAGDGSVTVSSLNLSGDNLDLSASGSFVQSGKSSLRLGIDMRDLSALFPDREEEVGGAIRAELDLSGDLIGGSFSAGVDAELIDLAGIPPDASALLGDRVRVEGKLKLDEWRDVDVPVVRLKGRELDLKARGNYRGDPGSVEAAWDVSIPDLRIIRETTGIPARGALFLSGNVRGRGGNYDAGLKIVGDELLYRAYELDSLGVRLTVYNIGEGFEAELSAEVHEAAHVMTVQSVIDRRGPLVTVSDFLIETAGTRIAGDLDIDTDHVLFDGAIRGESEDLTAIGRMLGEDLGGELVFDARFEHSGGEQHTGVELEGTNIDSRFAIIEKTTVRATVDDLFNTRRTSIDASFDGVNTRMIDSGEMTVNVSGDADRFVAGMSGKGRLLSGETFNVMLDGSIEQSSDTAEVSIGRLEGSLGKYDFSLNEPVSYLFGPGTSRLDKLDFSFGSGEVIAGGTITGGSVSFSASITRLPVRPLRHSGIMDMSGLLEGTLDITGSVEKPDVSLEITIRELKAMYAGEEFLQPATLSSTAMTSGDRLDASLTIHEDGTERVRADVSLPIVFTLTPFGVTFPENGELDGTISLDYELGKILGVFPPTEQSVTGGIRGRLDIGGTMSDPTVYGEVSLTNGTYENAVTGTMLRSVEAQVRARDERFEVLSFTASDGESGSITGSGWLEAVDGEGMAFEMNLSVSDARLVRQDDMTAVLTGTVTAEGSGGETALRGDLTIRSADITVPERLPPDIARLDVIEINREGERIAPAEKDTTSLGSNINLDLGITIPGTVFVRGFGLTSEWEGKLRITGTVDQPIVVGDLSVVRGRFTFVDKRFTLEEGKLVFTGSTPPSPDLDFLATTTVDDLDIRLRVRGEVDDLEMSLESSPPQPSDEILARLLFGRELDQITPYQALVLAQTARTLSGRGGGEGFMGKTRKLLNVDEIEVSEAEEGSGTKVGVGKYVSDEVYLKVEKSLNTDSGRVIVEVELTPSLTIESDVGTDQKTGIGVRWKHHY